ncbi:hypothetical protein [Anaerostipes sp.]|uniref:hypothetical protein n=1 Tax=Anaerostipes sp. TaxID=1872530 RepID=UPI0025BCEE47|nr:hypothetical protein [Anaerostipes sp.]MBS7007193.1 hypothetical protein [Anaerostipes sp.]
MSTEERLSEIEYQKKRMELNQRFVEMYEDEISYILEQKEDIEAMEKLSEEEAKILEEESRKYSRIFARIFYDSAGGRVSDEEFFPLWEREEEIRQGLSRIHSLEGEKKQIEKEIYAQGKEEAELEIKEQEFQGKFINRRAYFISTLVMALAAAGLCAAAVLYFEITLTVSLWPVAAAALGAVMILLVLKSRQHKAADRKKMYRMVRSHKETSGRRMQSEYDTIVNDLEFFREKYQVLFGYISEEQWKLFEFCAKVAAELNCSEELSAQREELVLALNRCGMHAPEAWCFYPKAIYDIPKRINRMEWLSRRQIVCEQAMVQHERAIRNNLLM